MKNKYQLYDLPLTLTSKIVKYIIRNNIVCGKWEFYYTYELSEIYYKIDLHCTEEDIIMLLLTIPNIKYKIK